MKHITIIGSGLSGLSASCYLAKNGYKVTLIDKNSKPGGRLSYFEKNGYKFDMGPSWYWMPDVFETFFNDFNKKSKDYYTLKRLDPSYKFFFEDNDQDVPADFNQLCELYESYEKGSSLKLKKFINQSEKKYNISLSHFISLPNNKISEYFSINILKHIFTLDLFKPLRKHINSYFKNKKIRDMLEFPSMFLGGSPQNTPALYSLMNYADIIKGTWYPMGGMYEITKAFSKLSKELGVVHIYNDEIKKFNIENNKIISITSDKNTYKSDYYISCAEYPHVQLDLINKKNNTYNKSYWSKRNVAPSSLIFYLGLNKKIKKLKHHNLFFDKDFDTHLDDIFNKKVWPKEPLFYVCCPSKTDSNVVPNKNSENLFILIPIGSGSIDNQKLRDKYYKNTIKRIEEKIGEPINDNIVVKESFCVNDFIKNYNSFKGNAYGLANTLFQTALFKPKLKDKKIKNLFYTGHFTVPGPGLPPAIISGKIVANQIMKENIS